MTYSTEVWYVNAELAELRDNIIRTICARHTVHNGKGRCTIDVKAHCYQIIIEEIKIDKMATFLRDYLDD